MQAVDSGGVILKQQPRYNMVQEESHTRFPFRSQDKPVPDLRS